MQGFREVLELFRRGEVLLLCENCEVLVMVYGREYVRL